MASGSFILLGPQVFWLQVHMYLEEFIEVAPKLVVSKAVMLNKVGKGIHVVTQVSHLGDHRYLTKLEKVLTCSPICKSSWGSDILD